MAKKKSAAKKTAKKTAKKKKTTRRKKKGPTPEEEWETLKSQVGLENLSSYSMTGTFAANSAIEHPKFGVGIVTAALPNKIQVAFKEGTKFLVHNRAT